jgi:hypothetical protein
MFKRLAKSRLAVFRLADLNRGGFRPLQPRRVTLRGAGLFNETHSNDNLAGFRRPKDQRRNPHPALVCHWFNRHGRLECRWQAEAGGDAPISDFDEHGAAGRTSGLSSTPPRGRGLALAG